MGNIRTYVPTNELKKYGDIFKIYQEGINENNSFICDSALRELHSFECDTVGLDNNRFEAYKTLIDFLKGKIDNTIYDMEIN